MIRAALKNPYLVIVAALAVTVLGIVSYGKTPADLLPEFKTSAVQIVTFYPGMPPEVMEKDIMSRLQRWTGQSVGISHQEAKAMQGVCIVKDYFREGISMDTAMSQVTSYAMSDMFYLPPGTIPPMVMPFDPTASVPLCLVVVSNSEMDEQELYDIAYFELRNKLQAIQGVIAPAVYGGKLRRILAYVDGPKLEAYGLSLMDVQQALLRQNVLIPAGNIKIGKQDLQIFTNAIPDTVEKLNDTPIKEVDGAPIFMRDIGRVENSHQIQSNVVRINRQRQVYIPIYRQPGANTIEIVKRINRLLPQILTRLQNERSEDPKMATLVLSVAMDQSQGVQESINGLQIAAGLGALLAGLVVFTFLRNLRSTLVVVLAIPLAILASLIGIYWQGLTINAMTLGGLALAIGILVDQSIVVLENVTRHREMGKSPTQAALDGAREVAIPILVSTITFIVVFIPVVFLTGMAKFLFTPLAIAASLAIVASYLISITLIPAYCAKFFAHHPDQPSATTTASVAPRDDWLNGLLRALIAMRIPIVLIALAAFAFSALALSRMGRELIPAIESPQFSIFVRMPTGTNINETERVIEQVEQVVMDVTGKRKEDEGHGVADPGFAIGREDHPNSNLQLLISNIGVLMDWPAAYTPNTGPMDAFMLVQLKGKAGMPGAFDYVPQLRQQLNEKFPDVEFAFDTGGMMTAALNMGEPSPIHFQIASSNLEKAQKIARIIRDTAAAVEGTQDVRIAQRIDYPALFVEVDRDAATRQGLTPEMVMKNLVAATNSSINFEPSFWIDPYKGNHYFFGVQYREENLNSLDSLRDIPLFGEWDQPRRLGNVCKITRTEGPAVVNHRNITRVTDVYVNVDPDRDVGGVCRAIEKALEANEQLASLPATDERGQLYQLGVTRNAQGALQPIDGHPFKGITFRMQGEVREMRDSFNQFKFGLVIAAILVYLVMVAQFRSFLDPFIILLTIPLGFIGVVVILLLTDTHLSIMSFMGIIMVVGIVVEYSIVLVDFANHRLHEGASIRESIIDATRVRMRPILMTSLTTWLALVPMAIGFAGGEANAPLARAIIGGVLGATILSLVVVPCLYVLLKRVPRELNEDDQRVLA